MAGYRSDLARLTTASNDLVLDVVEDLADRHETGAAPRWTASEVARHAERFSAELLALRDGFIEPNQPVLIEALRSEGALVMA